MPFSASSGSPLTHEYVHRCVLAQISFTSSRPSPLFRFSLLATIASIETSTIVVFPSCISLYTTAQPATEKFDIRDRPDVRLIGVHDLRITFVLGDLGLNGFSLDNKHANAFRKGYPGLGRVVWTGAIGRAALLLHLRPPPLPPTELEAGRTAGWRNLRILVRLHFLRPPQRTSKPPDNLSQTSRSQENT